MTGVLTKRGNLDMTCAQGECHAKMKAEIKVLLPQAEEPASSPAEARGEEGGGGRPTPA